MKTLLRKLFWFILHHFEKGDEPFIYKTSNRVILIVVGLLFIALSLIVIFFSQYMDGYGYLIPSTIFFLVGFVCNVIGLLGTDRAVAKIWGSRQ